MYFCQNALYIKWIIIILHRKCMEYYVVKKGEGESRSGEKEIYVYIYIYRYICM